MRRLLLLTIATILIYSNSFSQISKGSILLGGDLSFSASNTKFNQAGNEREEKAMSVFISPVFGKAVRENLIIGGLLGFGYGQTKGDNNTYVSKSYTAGAFLRKYKNIGNKGFYLFFQGSVTGEYSDMENPYYTHSERLACRVSGYPGVSFAITKKLHLESGFKDLVAINYSHEESTDVNSRRTEDTRVNFSSSLNNATSGLYLGFRLLIAK